MWAAIGVSTSTSKWTSLISISDDIAILSLRTTFDDLQFPEKGATDSGDLSGEMPNWRFANADESAVGADASTLTFSADSLIIQHDKSTPKTG